MNELLHFYLFFTFLQFWPYGPYLICKCTCTFTRMSSRSSFILQFHQNSSQLLFHIMVSLRGAGAFSRDFTTNLAPRCRAFSGALKIGKLKVPLFPDPRGAGDTNDWCIRVYPKNRGLCINGPIESKPPLRQMTF